MNILTLKSERKLIKGNFEKIYERENKITSIRLNLPAKVGNYNTNECNIELRAYIGENDYIGYEVDTSRNVADVPITTDITEKAQTVNFMCYITHNGNVIGKTNLVSVEVLEAPEESEPLTPREQFDTVIAEQRQTIAEQAETISEQVTQIEAKSEQISELNDEVNTLEGTVAEQQATITRQNTTIDELNRRVPPLETLDPINPTTEQVTYNPESPNIGFPQVIVNAPTAEGLGFRDDYYKKDEVFLGKVGTYNPFPEHSVGGIYITEVDEEYNHPKKVLVKGNFFSTPFSKMQFSYADLKECVFDTPFITSMEQSYFNGSEMLKKVILPQNLATLNGYMFYSCRRLKEVFLPGTLVSTIDKIAFSYCTQLEFVTIGNGFNADGLNLSASTLYSVETILSWLEALADRTGETAYTFCMGSTNLDKLTNEQKAIAINKNWNLA